MKLSIPCLPTRPKARDHSLLEQFLDEIWSDFLSVSELGLAVFDIQCLIMCPDAGSYRVVAEALNLIVELLSL